jgi:hypothetical protein
LNYLALMAGIGRFPYKQYQVIEFLENLQVNGGN